MKFNVKELNENYDFNIIGSSYIAAPKPNTAMYVAKKVERLVANLEGLTECLVFAENGVEVPKKIAKSNCFVFCDSPQLEYVKFINKMIEDEEKQNRQRKYTLTAGGYYIGENVSIGKNAYIEPGCIIGHDVQIGDNPVIYANVVIKNATIGDNFVVNEDALIGAHSFTMTKDEDGNRIRIPTLGRIIIGNNVEIGPLNNITRGQAGNTIIEDNCKLGSLVEIGHDDILRKNVELAPGVIVGGATELKTDAYAGLNSTIRNRLVVGERSYIGMQANVTKAVESGITVVGNPAKPLIKEAK